MKSKGGRKSLGSEMRIKQRYSALSVPYFNVLKGFLEGDNVIDQKFAISELTKAFVKMIPQSVDGGEDEHGNPIPLLYAISNNDSNTENSKTEEKA